MRLVPGFGRALVELWGGFGGALVEPWGGFGVAIRWLSVGFEVALRWLWVAWPGHSTPPSALKVIPGETRMAPIGTEGSGLALVGPQSHASCKSVASVSGGSPRQTRILPIGTDGAVGGVWHKALILMGL